MINKNSYLFYMANLGPEIGRINTFFKNGNIKAMNESKERSFAIIESVLKMPDLNSIGYQEIMILKNLLLNSAEDQNTIISIKKYCEPFAERFMKTVSF